MDNQDYCLLLAKDGIVLMRERSRNEIHAGVFGYTSAHIREHEHPSAENIEAVAHDRNNLMIPYARLKRIHFRRGFTCSTMRREYMLVIEYTDDLQIGRRIVAVVTPPPLPGSGVFGSRLDRTAAGGHALEVRRILSEALPDGSILVAEI